VETAGNFVALATKFSAGVQNSQHNFGGRLTRILRVLVNGDSSPVVNDATASVGQNRYVNACAEAGHSFVDRVVDDFPNQVV
jgi:hypothetical protein